MSEILPKSYKTIKKDCCLGGGARGVLIGFKDTLTSYVYLKYQSKLKLKWCGVRYNFLTQNRFTCAHFTDPLIVGYIPYD